MNRYFRYTTLVFGFALLMLAGTGVSQSQDKKAVKWTPSVELTKKSGAEWLLKEAKTGVKMVSDKDYLISALPKGAVGGTFLMRSSPELGKWLPAGTITAKANGTLYAVVLVNQYGKEKFTEVSQAKFVRDGWKELEEKAGTTFPSGEMWEWKAYKKEMKEGDQILQLDTLSWDKHGTAILYIFK